MTGIDIPLLAERFGSAGARAADLLRPLAYAEGDGLPRKDVWGLLANALAPGHGHDEADLRWLLERGESIVVESTTRSDEPVFRLAQPALAATLVSGRDRTADQIALTRALERSVPRRPNGRPDWLAAPHYVRHHLAAHAAAARPGPGSAADPPVPDLDRLAQDPGFLLAVPPARLLPALDHVTTVGGLACANAYRRSLADLRSTPPADHPGYLGLAARCAGVDGLADAIIRDDLDGRWRSRWASWRPAPDPAASAGPAPRCFGHDVAMTVAELDDRLVALIADLWQRVVPVWDLLSGQVVGDFPSPEHEILALGTAQRDARPTIVLVTQDMRRPSDHAVIQLRDLRTGAPVDDPFTVQDVATAAVADLDGRPVAVTGFGDGHVRVWDVAARTRLGTVHIKDEPVEALTVATLDGRAVVVTVTSDHPLREDGEDCACEGDHTMRVWDVSTGAPVGRPYPGHTGPIEAVAVAELDGRPVSVTGDRAGMVQVWDLATGVPLGRPFATHTDAIQSLAITRFNGRPAVVTAAADDDVVRIWDLSTGAPVGLPLTADALSMRAVAVAEVDERLVAITGSDDRTARIWDLLTGELRRDPSTGQLGYPETIAMAELDGRAVAVIDNGPAITVTDDGWLSEIAAWAPAIGAPFGASLGDDVGIDAVAVVRFGGRTVLVGSWGDGSPLVWDLNTSVPIGEPGYDGPKEEETRAFQPVAVAWLAGRPVAVTGEGRSVHLWDLAAATPLCEPLIGHTGEIRAVAVAEVGGRPVAVTGDSDGHLRGWDVATGRSSEALIASHPEAVNAVAARHEDPARLACAHGRTVTLYHLGSTFPGPPSLTTEFSVRLPAEVRAVAYRSDVVVAATGYGIVVMEIAAALPAESDRQ